MTKFSYSRVSQTHIKRAVVTAWCRKGVLSSSSASVGATENPSSNDKQSSWHPADIYWSSQLSPHGIDGCRAVKPCDDDGRRPADWNDAQNPRHYENRTSSHANVSFGPSVIVKEVRQAASDHSEADGQDADPNGGADQSPAALQVLRQSKNGVVGLTLHVAGALQYAVHPQTFPIDLGGDDVCPNERCHLPHRQRTDQYGSQKADDDQKNGNNVSLHVVKTQSKSTVHDSSKKRGKKQESEPVVVQNIIFTANLCSAVNASGCVSAEKGVGGDAGRRLLVCGSGFLFVLIPVQPDWKGWRKRLLKQVQAGTVWTKTALVLKDPRPSSFVKVFPAVF